MGEKSYISTHSELQHHMEVNDELHTRYTLYSLSSSRPSLDNCAEETNICSCHESNTDCSSFRPYHCKQRKNLQVQVIKPTFLLHGLQVIWESFHKIT